MPQITGVGSLTHLNRKDSPDQNPNASQKSREADSNRTDILRSQEEARVRQEEERNAQTQPTRNRQANSGENVGGTINVTV